MGKVGHEYSAPSSLNPGLLMFLVDKSLYNQQFNLMPVLRNQIFEICNRFRDANKNNLFRLIVCEFANSTQTRTHIPSKRITHEVTYGRQIKRLADVDIIEASEQNQTTYKFDRWVEEFLNSDAATLFTDNITVSGGTNLKSVIHQAIDEANYHHASVIHHNDTKPPISILMFSGGNHDNQLDYSYLPANMGRVRGELSEFTVDSLVEELLDFDNVLFGSFNIFGSNNNGERLKLATIFTKEMITKALSAERRYAIPIDQRLSSIFDDPIEELVGKKFIFNQEDIESKPKFLAALIRLGTSTIVDLSDNETWNLEDDDIAEGW